MVNNPLIIIRPAISLGGGVGVDPVRASPKKDNEPVVPNAWPVLNDKMMVPELGYVKYC